MTITVICTVIAVSIRVDWCGTVGYIAYQKQEEICVVATAIKNVISMCTLLVVFSCPA